MLVDSHCHLDLAQYDDDRDVVLAQARETGVRLIVNPGIDLIHSKRAIELAEQHDEIYAAVGIHPNSSHEFADPNRSQAIIEELAELARHEKVVAIGEIGLDYYWNKVDPSIQKIAFEQQLELASQVGLPVIIHSRESNEDVSHILGAWSTSPSVRESKLQDRAFLGVLHAFSGDLEMACAAYEWGFILSLGGPVTFKNARRLHELVPQLRLERLMLETDGPFLTPHPHRGERNVPAHVSLVCERIAELYSASSEATLGEVAQEKPVSAEIVAEMTSELAYRFFDIAQKEF